MLVAVVLGTLYSGVCSFAVSQSVYHDFDAFIDKKCRSLLKGAATFRSVDIDGVEHVRSLQSKLVMRRCGVAPSSVELCVQRLQWFQSVAKDPLHHELYLSAMFGHFKHEEVDGHAQLKHDRAGPTHPWMCQLVDDIEKCHHWTMLSLRGTVMGNPSC